jgi:hypothetical protein
VKTKQQLLQFAKLPTDIKCNQNPQSPYNCRLQTTTTTTTTTNNVTTKTCSHKTCEVYRQQTQPPPPPQKPTKLIYGTYSKQQKCQKALEAN